MTLKKTTKYNILIKELALCVPIAKCILVNYFQQDL